MKENRVKPYGVIIGIVSVALQHGLYLGAHKLSLIVGNTPVCPKISAIDDLIPIISLFLIPYAWSYVYWAMAPMAVSKCSTAHFKKYIAAYIISCLMGAVIIIFMPTYMDRAAEGLTAEPTPEILRFWYTLDGGDMAYNLFPSFHCINSTISYLGVMGRKEIPKWYRIYSLVLTVLIYVATVTVKQHYIVDVLGGIAIAFIGWFTVTAFCFVYRAARQKTFICEKSTQSQHQSEL